MRGLSIGYVDFRQAASYRKLLIGCSSKVAMVDLEKKKVAP